MATPSQTLTTTSPALTAASAVVALGVHGTPGASAALSGWWTGHLSHWSTGHLLWDLVVFVLLGAVVEARHGRATLAAVIAAGVALGGLVGHLLHHPDLATYRGLSAVDTALFAFVLARSPWLALLTAKLAVETWLGRPLFAADMGPGVTLAVGAHLGGALAGLTVAWALQGTSRRLPDRSRTRPGAHRPASGRTLRQRACPATCSTTRGTPPVGLRRAPAAAPQLPHARVGSSAPPGGTRTRARARRVPRRP